MLAIGIVVDDAIVVVEAVEHHIEHGLSPREATHQGDGAGLRPGDRRRPGAGAVFVPCAFISGITGQFFRQFALTIAVSTVISAFNSLTLSPALSALLLRPHQRAAGRTCCRMLAYVAIGGWAGYAWLTAGYLALRRWTRPAGRRCCRPLRPGAVSAVVAVALGRRSAGSWRGR